MARVDFRVTVPDDGSAATLEMVVGDKIVGHAVMEAPDLDAFIDVLRQTRMRLSDEVPRELDPGSRIQVIEDPVWRIPNPDSGSRMLVLRHPGFGWLGFHLPEAEARAIAEWLTKEPPQKPSS